MLFHIDAAGEVDCDLQFTNDAETPGDGMGGLVGIVAGLLSLLTTNGYGITVTDSSGAVVVSANSVQLAGSGTTAGNAAMNATLTENALTAFKDAMVAAGVTNADAIVVPTVAGSTRTFTA